MDSHLIKRCIHSQIDLACACVPVLACGWWWACCFPTDIFRSLPIESAI